MQANNERNQPDWVMDLHKAAHMERSAAFRKQIAPGEDSDLRSSHAYRKLQADSVFGYQTKDERRDAHLGIDHKTKQDRADQGKAPEQSGQFVGVNEMYHPTRGIPALRDHLEQEGGSVLPKLNLPETLYHSTADPAHAAWIQEKIKPRVGVKSGRFLAGFYLTAKSIFGVNELANTGRKAVDVFKFKPSRKHKVVDADRFFHSGEGSEGLNRGLADWSQTEGSGWGSVGLGAHSKRVESKEKVEGNQNIIIHDEAQHYDALGEDRNKPGSLNIVAHYDEQHPPPAHTMPSERPRSNRARSQAPPAYLGQPAVHPRSDRTSSQQSPPMQSEPGSEHKSVRSDRSKILDQIVAKKGLTPRHPKA
jgi:hypothetical protein